MFVLLASLVSLAAAHKCPQDPSFSCNDDQTCCQLPQGEGVGCCPYKEATCCRDRTHCCPHGLVCDIKAGRCTGDSYHLLLATLAPGTGVVATPNSIRRRGVPSPTPLHPHFHLSGGVSPSLPPLMVKKACSDPSFSCEDSQTCCELSTGGYGCCPLGGDAVCCADKEHCCPHGYTCDPAGGSCSPAP